VTRTIYRNAPVVSGVLHKPQYQLYDYVQAELYRPDGRYVLTAGRWFRVAASYVEEVDAYVRGLDDRTSTLQMPSWESVGLSCGSERAIEEGDYNAQVAERRRYILMDRQNLYFGHNKEGEVCDLLTPAKGTHLREAGLAIEYALTFLRAGERRGFTHE